jgi:hypothetical protein
LRVRRGRGLLYFRHPAPGHTPRYSTDLLRVRHAPMLPNEAVVPRPDRLYNQGVSKSRHYQATDGPVFASD